uniref:Restriction alleviation protein n=1 Tax=virus sp. ctLl75 TaxID=2828249 RepID=A0A8S5RB41_9VIRU|nr:MAG TPA: restriction alleviation protein [virus sp. ctLl75]
MTVICPFCTPSIQKVAVVPSLFILQIWNLWSL